MSVLVPVLNEADHIRSAVAAMASQRHSGGVEILLIDGGSDDGTLAILDELVREHDRIRLLHNPARRTPNALNLGLHHARGEYVARMDAHAYYPSDYLARGIERLRGDVVWASGPVIPYGPDRGSRRIALALGTRLGVGGARFREQVSTEVEVDTGFTGIWRRETLLAHDGWDEGWPVNQDGELAARTRKAGGRIVCVPEMAARSVPRSTLAALARQYWRYGQYRVKTARRHPESLRRSHVLPPGLVLAFGAATAKAPMVRAPARAGLACYAAALVATSVRACGKAGTSRADAAALPAVLATMHLAWGAGFLRGCLRFGVPLSALRGVASSSAETFTMRAERARTRG